MPRPPPRADDEGTCQWAVVRYAPAMTNPTPDRPSAADAVAEHVAALSHDAAALARAELEAARRDLSTSARRAAESGALLGVAGACGALALGASGVLVVRVLDKALPPVLSALVATGGLGAAAVVLGGTGLERVRAALRAPAG